MVKAYFRGGLVSPAGKARPNLIGILFIAAVTADSARVYMALNGADRVVVLDLERRAVISTIAADQGPGGLTWVRGQ